MDTFKNQYHQLIPDFSAYILIAVFFFIETLKRNNLDSPQNMLARVFWESSSIENCSKQGLFLIQSNDNSVSRKENCCRRPVHTHCIGVKADISETNISNPNETKTDVCANVPRAFFFLLHLRPDYNPVFDFPKKTN